MKLQDYRNAVSGIRWSDAQRARMEELLRMPADSVEFEAATEFTEVASVRRDDFDATAEKNEKRLHINRRVFLVLAAAAILTAGGTGAAVAFSHQGRTETSSVPDIHDEDSPITLTGLELTDEYDDPAARGYSWKAVVRSAAMPADNGQGWYYQDGDPEPVMSYYDILTRTQLPLCTQPQCLHDGSIYCPASTSAFISSAPVYVNGDVYTLAQKRPQIGSSDSDRKWVLLRYAPDGTEISELTSFGKCTTQAQNFQPPVFHRGYLWCIIPMSSRPDNAPDDWVGGGGYAIYGYELATGKTVTLMENDPEDPDVRFTPPTMLWGDGDYLYFNVAYSTDLNKSPLLPKEGLWRLNMCEGNVEHVMKHQAAFVGSGYAFYYDYTEGNLQTYDIYRRDLTTGDVVSVGASDTYLIWNGQYMLRVNAEHTATHSTAELRICDADGNTLYDLPAFADDNIVNVGIQGDNVIVIHITPEDCPYQFEMLYGSLRDMEAGKFEWKPGYTMWQRSQE